MLSLFRQGGRVMYPPAAGSRVSTVAFFIFTSVLVHPSIELDLPESEQFFSVLEAFRNAGIKNLHLAYEEE